MKTFKSVAIVYKVDMWKIYSNKLVFSSHGYPPFEKSKRMQSEEHYVNIRACSKRRLHITILNYKPL